MGRPDRSNPRTRARARHSRRARRAARARLPLRCRQARGLRELQFRYANADDAEQVALLHADSWRRNYRGAFADSFLDGDLAGDRLAVWSARLAAPAGTETILAEDGDRLVGFVHVVLDDDPAWGSLVDNLHVTHDRRRTGIGTQLLAHAARAVAERAVGNALYLWVLEQNTAAQRFYRASGAVCVETATSSPPGATRTASTARPANCE